jgi:nitric oxide reductase subunit B
MTVSEPAQPREDRVSNVLKWVLLGIAVITFGVLGWATDVTYRTAPPQPERFLAPAALC